MEDGSARSSKLGCQFLKQAKHVQIFAFTQLVRRFHLAAAVAAVVVAAAELLQPRPPAVAVALVCLVDLSARWNGSILEDFAVVVVAAAAVAESAVENFAAAVATTEVAAASFAAEAFVAEIDGEFVLSFDYGNSTQILT